MEIDQYIYDLNESGDAIVAYRMIAENGGMVEICNLAASVLSWSVPQGDGKMLDLASGRCVRGLRGMSGSDNWGGVRFEEMLWESRVEVNRVVMSLSWESDGVGMMSEVVFDYDDDNTLEITYIACSDAPYEVDLTHKLSFTLGGGERVEILSDDAQPSADMTYGIRDAKCNILSEVATLVSDSCRVDLLSSAATLYYEPSSSILSPVTSPAQQLAPAERYIQKSCYRVTRG